MAREPGGKNGPRSTGRPPAEPPGEFEAGESLNVLPDLMRRVFSAGLSSFFSTEEAVRKALGETLPQDWSDFAIEQSDRTRAELLDRLSAEIGRTIEKMDLAEILSKLLEGNTVEINASIRLRPEKSPGDSKLEIRTKGA